MTTGRIYYIICVKPAGSEATWRLVSIVSRASCISLAATAAPVFLCYNGYLLSHSDVSMRYAGVAPVCITFLGESAPVERMCLVKRRFRGRGHTLQVTTIYLLAVSEFPVPQADMSLRSVLLNADDTCIWAGRRG